MPPSPSKRANAYAAEFVPVASLKPHPRNYRTHPDEQLAHIAASIRQHGFFRNVVAARDGTILAGHGIVEAAKREGIERVPVLKLDVDPNDPRALKVLTADNELGRFAESDDRVLTELLKELSQDDAAGLLGTGYDDMALAALVMVTRPASEIAGFDAAAAWAGMPDCDSGGMLYRLVVQFRTEADREEFVSRVGLRMTARQNAGSTASGPTWSCWWPDREKEDSTSLKWAEGDEPAEAE